MIYYILTYFVLGLLMAMEPASLEWENKTETAGIVLTIMVWMLAWPVYSIIYYSAMFCDWMDRKRGLYEDVNKE